MCLFAQKLQNLKFRVKKLIMKIFFLEFFFGFVDEFI
jgi:hypothetical protein